VSHDPYGLRRSRRSLTAPVMLKLLNSQSLLWRPHSVKVPWLGLLGRRLVDDLSADRELELVDLAIDESVDVEDEVALF